MKPQEFVGVCGFSSVDWAVADFAATFWCALGAQSYMHALLGIMHADLRMQQQRPRSMPSTSIGHMCMPQSIICMP